MTHHATDDRAGLNPDPSPLDPERYEFIVYRDTDGRLIIVARELPTIDVAAGN